MPSTCSIVQFRCTKVMAKMRKNQRSLYRQCTFHVHHFIRPTTQKIDQLPRHSSDQQIDNTYKMYHRLAAKIILQKSDQIDQSCTEKCTKINRTADDVPTFDRQHTDELRQNKMSSHFLYFTLNNQLADHNQAKRSGRSIDCTIDHSRL